MSLLGKLEGDTEIKAPAHLFYDVCIKPHHISTITPDNIHICELHEGEFGKEGTILKVDYTHDGKKKATKYIAEKIDDKNMTVTYKAVEGDLVKEYKSFKITVQVTPKESGSLIHWTLDYEKNNQASPEPHSILDLLNHIAKDVNAHLIKPQS